MLDIVYAYGSDVSKGLPLPQRTLNRVPCVAPNVARPSRYAAAAVDFLRLIHFIWSPRVFQTSPSSKKRKKNYNPLVFLMEFVSNSSIRRRLTFENKYPDFKLPCWSISRGKKLLSIAKRQLLFSTTGQFMKAMILTDFPIEQTCYLCKLVEFIS